MIYADAMTAMVDINFSRLNQDKDVLSTTDATYLLVNKKGKWLLKGAFINSNLSLGEWNYDLYIFDKINIKPT